MKFIEEYKNTWSHENLTRWGLTDGGNFNQFTLADHLGAALPLEKRWNDGVTGSIA